MILATTGNILLQQSSQMEIAYNVTNGQMMWVQNRTTPTATIAYTLMGPMGNGVYTEWDQNKMQWTGYDTQTGLKLWGPSEALTRTWDTKLTGSVIAYDKLYTLTIAGLHCYDLKTGKHLWDYYADPCGLETPFPTWPFYSSGFTIADQKVFITSSSSFAIYRGSKLFCIDAQNGTELWSELGAFQEGTNNPVVIADGYIVATNQYDNQIYCFGKGQSATTISAPTTVQSLGSSVLLQGTVTDQSPGNTCIGIPAKGTPAISDEYMSEWMEYLYQQQPKPKDAEGVEVVLTTYDPNGNTYEIGRTTSTDRGTFGCNVDLPVPGLYKIIATFEGSESYYGSSAETYVTVTEAPSVAQPIEPEVPAEEPTVPEEPAVPEAPTEEPTEEPTAPEEPTEPEPTEPTETPLITTEAAIMVAVAVAVVIGVAAYWVLRKRK
jgi:outer membrane protein assembly factor BamB